MAEELGLTIEEFTQLYRDNLDKLQSPSLPNLGSTNTKKISEGAV